MKRESPKLSMSKPKKIDKLNAKIMTLMLLIFTDKKISQSDLLIDIGGLTDQNNEVMIDVTTKER